MQEQQKRNSARPHDQPGNSKNTQLKQTSKGLLIVYAHIRNVLIIRSPAQIVHNKKLNGNRKVPVKIILLPVDNAARKLERYCESICFRDTSTKFTLNDNIIRFNAELPRINLKNLLGRRSSY